jgi:hypothetical protein
MYTLLAAAVVALLSVVSLLRHHRKRARLYHRLAHDREQAVARHPPRIAAPVDPAALREDFKRDRLARIDKFLDAETFAAVRAECVANRQRIERSFIMTLCTDPRIGWLREPIRRIKDTAYYGPRVLFD